MQAALSAPPGPFEVLAHIGPVGLAAVDPGLLERLRQDLAGRPHERLAGTILAIAGLLAYQHQACPWRSLTEHRLRSGAPQRTGMTGRRCLPQPLERGLVGDQLLGWLVALAQGLWPGRVSACRHLVPCDIRFPACDSRVGGEKHVWKMVSVRIWVRSSRSLRDRDDRDRLRTHLRGGDRVARRRLPARRYGRAPRLAGRFRALQRRSGAPRGGPGRAPDRDRRAARG